MQAVKLAGHNQTPLASTVTERAGEALASVAVLEVTRVELQGLASTQGKGYIASRRGAGIIPTLDRYLATGVAPVGDASEALLGGVASRVEGEDLDHRAVELQWQQIASRGVEVGRTTLHGGGLADRRRVDGGRRRVGCRIERRNLEARGYRERARATARRNSRSEEHTSELQSLMRHSYAVFCL